MTGLSVKWLKLVITTISMSMVFMFGYLTKSMHQVALNDTEVKLIELLIPSFISVIGWFVALSWTIKQTNLASKSNRDLQKEILILSERAKTVENVVNDMININCCLMKIKQYVENIKVNIQYKQAGKCNPDLKELFNKASEPYQELYLNMDRLKMNHSRASIYLEKPPYIDLYLHTIHKEFSNNSDWEIFQSKCASYFTEQHSDVDVIINSIDQVASNCVEISYASIRLVEMITACTRYRQKGAWHCVELLRFWLFQTCHCMLSVQHCKTTQGNAGARI